MESVRNVDFSKKHKKMNNLAYENGMRELIAMYLKRELPDHLQRDLKSALCACALFESGGKDKKGKRFLMECLVKMESACREYEEGRTVKERIDNLYRW